MTDIWRPSVTVAAILEKDGKFLFVEELRKRLLNEAGVAVLADIHFGARVPGEGQHLRFSYAASREQIEQGAARIEAFIRKNTRKAA